MKLKLSKKSFCFKIDIFFTLFSRQAPGLVISHLALRVGVRTGYILAGVTAFITEKYIKSID